MASFFSFQNLMHNGSMYIHVYFVLPGYSPDPTSDEKYSKQYTFSATKRKHILYND